jgi:hypothetical protein
LTDEVVALKVTESIKLGILALEQKMMLRITLQGV